MGKNKMKKHSNQTEQKKKNFSKPMKAKKLDKQVSVKAAQKKSARKKSDMKVTFQSPIKTVMDTVPKKVTPKVSKGAGQKVNKTKKEGPKKTVTNKAVVENSGEKKVQLEFSKQVSAKLANKSLQQESVHTQKSKKKRKDRQTFLKQKEQELDPGVQQQKSNDIEECKAIRPKDEEQLVTKAPLTSDSNEQLLKEHNKRSGEYNARCIFVKPVPNGAVPKLLKDLSNEILGVRIPVAKRGKVKGFAFLEFKDSSQANGQKKTLAGKSLAGRPLQVRDSTYPVARSAEDVDFTSLFVAGLSSDVRINHLQTSFLKNKAVEMATCKDGSCAGTAIVRFASKAEALKAFKLTHGKKLCGKDIVVYFAKSAFPRSIQQAGASPLEAKGKRVGATTAKTGTDSEDEPDSHQEPSVQVPAPSKKQQSAVVGRKRSREVLESSDSEDNEEEKTAKKSKLLGDVEKPGSGDDSEDSEEAYDSDMLANLAGSSSGAESDDDDESDGSDIGLEKMLEESGSASDD